MCSRCAFHNESSIYMYINFNYYIELYVYKIINSLTGTRLVWVEKWADIYGHYYIQTFIYFKFN